MAVVDDDYTEAPEPPSGSFYEDILPTSRLNQQGQSTLLFDATISKDASQGTESYPTFKPFKLGEETPASRLREYSDDEGEGITEAPLDDKWSQHRESAAEYMQKARRKTGKASMPQKLSARPPRIIEREVEQEADMASSPPRRQRERIHVIRPTRAREDYYMPEPPPLPRRVVLEERPRTIPPQPSRRLSPSPPASYTDEDSYEREPVARTTRANPVRRHRVTPAYGPSYDPQPRVPPVRYPERHREPLPDFYSEAVVGYPQDPHPILVPRRKPRLARGRESKEVNGRHHPVFYEFLGDHRRNRPSQNFEPPLSDILNTGVDYQYSAASSKTHSQQSVRAEESEDELNHAWTPEDVDSPRSKPGARSRPARSSKYRILCRIECDEAHDKQNGHPTHSALMYEDVPHWNPRFTRTSPHLTGLCPIYNLSQWLRSIDPLGFVVYRTYSCSYDSFRYNQMHRDDEIVMPEVQVKDSEAQDFNESMEILSSDLERAIFKVAKCKIECFTGLSDPYSQPDNLKLHSPYLFLYHHRSLLSELSKEDKSFRAEILPLLIYLKERQRGLYKQADGLFAKNMTDANVLKFLFCPNEIVVSQKNGVETAYAIRYLHFHPDDSIQLVSWAWTYDGSNLKRKSEKLQVTFKAGVAKVVSDLAAYPLRFASEDVKARLLARGARFWELRTPQLVTYKGMNFLQEKYINEGRCMLDYPTYKIMHRDADAFNHRTDKSPLDYDNHPETIGKDEELSEDAMILCPPNIHGYLLKEKAWVNLLVDNVYAVTWNKDAFKRLVMPPNTKDLVEALIKAHASASWQQGGLVSGKRLDLIAGKGLGLIMLLHGSPGTGKTLTAESVAEIAEMPLYSVTCGDIGIEVEKVEQYLQTVLYLGKTWNCVLLLDEADVFLEERSLNDLKRNSLVSVFLRTLEYYEGILILTSNRVGIFDEAFRSRIQLALHYPKLTPLFRRKIWQNFFDILSEDKEDVDLIELQSHMDELCQREMNGREIRNALTSARQLASYKKITLRWDHLKETLDIGKVFGDYLRDVHGHADEDWAREEQLR